MIKAIVTGHSRGLGEALAAALLQRGVAVLGLSRQGNAALAARHGGALSELALDLGEGGEGGGVIRLLQRVQRQGRDGARFKAE